MKNLFLALCASSLTFGAPMDEIINESASEQTPAEELAANTMIQQPMPLEVQIPAPTFTPSRKSPLLAAGLSILIPGLGHTYLGDMKTATALFGSSCLGMGAASLAQSNKTYESSSLLAVQTTWSYGIYAAYRDARNHNGQSGYSYKMPTDSFADLTLAPFRWSVLKKTEVWGGFLGAFAAAVGTIYLSHPKEAHIDHFSLSTKWNLSPAVALPIGIGEESLFRGYLQSQLTEILNPWAGIALSSLAFGAMHIPNARNLEPEHRRRYYTYNIPFITAFGAYFGWLTYKNQSLKESVALHTWYDFVLFSLSSLATETAATGRPSFALSIPL